MKNTLSLLLCSLALVACGGGSSSSGGPAPAPALLAQVGVYEGISMIQLTSANAPPTSSEGPIRFTVSGPAQNQQVLLAFREFSGTSALDPELRFTIPSGTLRIPVGNGQECTGQITYMGQFVGSRVTGTETGTFNCPGGVVISTNGTFEADFIGAGKFNPPTYSMFPEGLLR